MRNILRIKEQLLISDVIATPDNFNIGGSPMLHRIWKAWKVDAPMIAWHWDGYRRGFNLACHSIKS